MVFGNGVKSIQAAAYNGARTVHSNEYDLRLMRTSKLSFDRNAKYHLI